MHITKALQIPILSVSSIQGDEDDKTHTGLERMDSLKAAEDQRPSFTFWGCRHKPLELSNLPNNHLVRCSGCTLSILDGRGYYTCRPCSFSLHSYCFKTRPLLCRHCPLPLPPLTGLHFPLRDLSVFHAEFSVITSAVMTAQNSPAAGLLDGAAPQPTPSTVYPPLLLTAYGIPHQESTVIQLQLLTLIIEIGIGTSQAQPQFDGFGYRPPVGNGIRIVPVPPGLRKRAGVFFLPVMAGVRSGIEEGIGQEHVPSTAIGFRHRFFRLFGSELTPTNSWEHRLLYLFLCFSVFLCVYLGYSMELSTCN